MLRFSSYLIICLAVAAAAKPMVNDQWTAKWHTHAPDAKNVQLKWSDCSGGNMHVKNVDVNFNGGKAVTLGEPLSVTATGNVDESVTGGQYTFSAKAGFIPVAKHTDTVCGTTSFNVLAIGKVTVHGVDCAGTKAGPLKIEIDMNLPKIAPDASVDIKVQGADSSKGGLFCVDVKATVVGSAVGPLEEPKAKCDGTGTLPGAGPFCYHASIGMLGVKENLDLKVVKSVDSTGIEKGTMDLVGSGVSPFKCKGIAITKNGQDIQPDPAALKHCLPRGVSLKSAKYCSTTDQVLVTVSDSNIPVVGRSITKTAARVKCASTDGPTVTEFEDPKPLKSLPVSWEVVPRVGCLQAGKCCLDCRGDCCSHEWHTTLKCGSLHRCD
jgi:hypothetical protein